MTSIVKPLTYQTPLTPVVLFVKSAGNSLHSNPQEQISPFRKERHIGASPLSWIRNKPVATPPCTSIRKPHRHPYHINTFPDLATQLSPSILVLSLETTTQVMTPAPYTQTSPTISRRECESSLTEPLTLLLSSASTPHFVPYSPIYE